MQSVDQIGHRRIALLLFLCDLASESGKIPFDKEDSHLVSRCKNGPSYLCVRMQLPVIRKW